MANLFFPQLLTGAVAQMPLRAANLTRTVLNVFADGSTLSYADVPYRRKEWALQLDNLSQVEMSELQGLFASCNGALLPFTFLDPVDNLLVSSTDPSSPSWIADPGILLTTGAPDPEGASAAHTLTNPMQAPAGIHQTVPVPSNYQYAITIFARSTSGAPLHIQATGSASNTATSYSTDSNWRRYSLSPRLSDPGTSLSVTFSTDPGCSIQVFGPQFEPHGTATGYKPTYTTGGVYPNAFWLDQELEITATGSGLFSVRCNIEATY